MKEPPRLFCHLYREKALKIKPHPAQTWRKPLSDKDLQQVYIANTVPNLKMRLELYVLQNAMQNATIFAKYYSQYDSANMA